MKQTLRCTRLNRIKWKYMSFELQRGRSVAVFSAIKKHWLIQIAFRVLQTVICYYEPPRKRNSSKVPAIQRYTTRMNVKRFYLLLHSIALRTLSILTLDTKYLTHNLYRNFFFLYFFCRKKYELLWNHKFSSDRNFVFSLKKITYLVVM